SGSQLREGALAGHDGGLLPALELAFVEVALLRGPELATGERTFVEGVVELAGRNAVTDPVQIVDSSLEGEVQILVRFRARCKDDGLDGLKRFVHAAVAIDELDTVTIDGGRP